MNRKIRPIDDRIKEADDQPNMFNDLANAFILITIVVCTIGYFLDCIGYKK